MRSGGPVGLAAWIAVAILAASGTSPGAALPEVFPFYVGEGACRECHGESKEGLPCAVDPVPRHERSYRSLGKPEAAHVAALSGVLGAPTESRLCLNCHAAAADEGPRWTAPTFDRSRGVQCEACHGAGSLHVATRSPGRPGPELPHSRHDVRRGTRETTCARCHYSRASHDEVLVRGYRRPETDVRYKTPVNLAVSEDGRLLYVVCTNDATLTVVDLETRSVVDEIPVGRRPHDVVISPGGKRLLVTSRFDDTVTVIDAATRAVRRVIPVGADPHGLATDRRGDRLYVLNSGQDTVSVIDRTLAVEEKRLVTGDGPWSIARRGDGGAILVTNVRPQPARFREPLHSEITEISTARGVVLRRIVVPDANMLQGIDYVPGTGTALFTLMRTKNLVPSTRLLQGWSITNGLGVVWPDGRVDQLLLDAPHDHFADPNDVAVSPDGTRALVTGGGVDEVAVVDVAALLSRIDRATEEQRRSVLPNHLGQSRHFVLRRVPVGSNPRAVAFAADGRHAFVANALSDSITVLEAPEFDPVAEIPLGGPDIRTETRRGEILFHGARNAYGNQFSCRSCHPDGHVNGLTFDIEPDGAGRSPVDNRTLRGILDTAPFKWEGTNPDLRRQCGARLAVFFTRLEPFTPDEVRALDRYVSTIPGPPNPYREPAGLTDEQRLGKLVFERTLDHRGRPLRNDQRCAGCHGNAHGTTRERFDVGTTMWFDESVAYEFHDLEDIDSFGPYGMLYFINAPGLGREFDTPHLINVYDSPPYLHNGAAPTLEEIWTRFNTYEGHGVTIDLTRRELNAMVAYLKSL